MLALGAVGIAVWALLTVQNAETVDDLATEKRDKAKVEGQADANADKTLALCGQGDKVAKALFDAGLCGGAERLKEIVGPTGPAGEPGVQGPQGPPGPKGDRGEPGRTPPCLAEPAGCQGQDGADGANGAPGEPGTAGPQGEPGASGPAGQDGTDGADGQPPAGWTWTDPSPGGKTYTCTRDVDSPDSAPTYTCTAA